jgi:hydrogenase maturation protein HypF
VPRAIRLARRVPAPVLAVGADLKNTFCLAVGDAAYLGPHIGDLERLESQHALTEAADRMARMLLVSPEIVAHDRHPGYASTALALDRPEPIKVGVQHHHAHVAAAMAEHGLVGPVLGFAWDGTGWGDDGTAWGGELLLARFDGFERLATFRALPLAGGDLAIRQIWRIALAAIDDAFVGAPPQLDRLALFRAVDPAHVSVVRRMIATGLHAPRARGVGRWFDAISALVLAKPEARSEGHAALALELAAAPGRLPPYAFAIGDVGVPEVDLRPTVREVVCDLLDGRPRPMMAARFHETLIRAAAELVRRTVPRARKLPIVLTGGCMQNARLAEGLRAALSPVHFTLLHQHVPPGDGGIALGQALVASTIARRS